MFSSFFSWIGTKIVALQDAVGGWLFDIWDRTSVTVVKIWALLVIMSIVAWEGLTLVGDLTIRAIQGLSFLAGTGWYAAVNDPAAPSGLLTALAIANTFFPLNELLRYIAALITFVWLPIGLYRLVKSWIPTLSGSG